MRPLRFPRDTRYLILSKRDLVLLVFRVILMKDLFLVLFLMHMLRDSLRILVVVFVGVCVRHAQITITVVILRHLLQIFQHVELRNLTKRTFWRFYDIHVTAIFTFATKLSFDNVLSFSITLGRDLLIIL